MTSAGEPAVEELNMVIDFVGNFVPPLRVSLEASDACRRLVPGGYPVNKITAKKNEMTQACRFLVIFLSSFLIQYGFPDDSLKNGITMHWGTRHVSVGDFPKASFSKLL